MKAPPRHAGLEWSDLRAISETHGEAILRARSIAATCAGVWAILGERGCGKTQIAVCMGKEFMDAGRGQCAYLRAIDLFMLIRECYNGGANPERRVLDAFASVPMLVLDEAHERGGSPWENQTLQYLIDRRYATPELLTLIASNQRPRDFALGMGESIIRRIRETGELIVFNWKPLV